MQDGQHHDKALQLPFPPGPDGAPPPLYDQLRSQCPVAHITTPAGDRVMLVLTAEDARFVYEDPAKVLSRNLRHPGTPRYVDGADPTMVPGTMMNEDDPVHLRLRRAVARWFTPRAVEGYRDLLAGIAGDFADSLLSCNQPADVVPVVAAPLPVRVISRVIGFPEDDDVVLSALSSTILSTSTSDAEQRHQAAAQFVGYIQEIIGWQRQEGPQGTLLAQVVEDSDNGTGLTDAELVQSLLTLILAGHETTAHMIARGVLRLVRTGMWKRIADEPAMIPDAIQELLRLDVPGHGGILRLATEDVTLPSGTILPAGTGILAPTVVHNHDPARYPSPHEFVLGRDPGHLTFGAGTHYCLGAYLAVAELETVFATLTARIPTLSLVDSPDAVAWSDPTLKISGPTRLLVTW
jgi:cytochrome P450